jgi:2-succinyl-5-enolpyruvyl-6-hydroxy-3-cyclohexene-1-carboxylate synthase
VRYAGDVADDPNAPLEQMILALANVSAIEQVMGHEQARHHVDELRTRVQAVVAKMRLELEDADKRKQVATEIDKLVDTVAHIQNDVGKSVAGASDRLKAATRAKTLAGMAQALRLISDWLGQPTAQNQLQVDQLIANLRALTGADPFLDDAKAEAKLHAEIEADVKQSLADIFSDLKIDPPL